MLLGPGSRAPLQPTPKALDGPMLRVVYPSSISQDSCAPELSIVIQLHFYWDARQELWSYSATSVAHYFLVFLCILYLLKHIPHVFKDSKKGLHCASTYFLFESLIHILHISTLVLGQNFVSQFLSLTLKIMMKSQKRFGIKYFFLHWFVDFVLIVAKHKHLL